MRVEDTPRGADAPRRGMKSSSSPPPWERRSIAVWSCASAQPSAFASTSETPSMYSRSWSLASSGTTSTAHLAWAAQEAEQTVWPARRDRAAPAKYTAGDRH